MPINLNEALIRMRKAGPTGVRSVPMKGQRIDNGLYQIEILDGSNWAVLVESIPKKVADDLIAQATNRLICG